MSRIAQSTAIEAIYGAALDSSGWANMLERVSDHLGLTGGMLLRHDFQGDGGFFIGARLREDLTPIYLDRYKLNPYSLSIVGRPPGRPIVSSELVPDEVIRATAFHSDILATQRIASLILMPLVGLHGPGGSGGISFTATPGQVDGIGEAARRFARLGPHLARGVELSLTLSRLRRETGLARGVLEAMPGPALLLDRHGRVLRLNAEAEALLALADGIGLVSGEGPRLQASLLEEDRRLWRFLRLALEAAAGEDTAWRQALRLARPSGRASYVVVATPLPLGDTSPLLDLLARPARLLLQIIDPEPKARDIRLLREAYGLTVAEARVTALVGLGLSLPQTARTLGVSVNTARTHLHRVFDKTGLRSQVTLARMLTALPRG